ncbi:DUF6053 domain-containing protein [Lysobacter enzymogenes]|uniref:DUF6053 domain-containing protein n=1 Tax=Lysobacter enzymogenes TaxID=69 RepID=UPI003D2F8331
MRKFADMAGVRARLRRIPNVGGASAPMLFGQIVTTGSESIGAEAPPTTTKAAVRRSRRTAAASLRPGPSAAPSRALRPAARPGSATARRSSGTARWWSWGRR